MKKRQLTYFWTGTVINTKIKLGLNYKEVQLLLYILRFAESCKMEWAVIDGNIYFWLDYDTCIKHLGPVIDIYDTRTINKLIKSLKEKQIILVKEKKKFNHITQKHSGTMIFVALNFPLMNFLFGDVYLYSDAPTFYPSLEAALHYGIDTGAIDKTIQDLKKMNAFNPERFEENCFSYIDASNAEDIASRAEDVASLAQNDAELAEIFTKVCRCYSKDKNSKVNYTKDTISIIPTKSVLKVEEEKEPLKETNFKKEILIQHRESKHLKISNRKEKNSSTSIKEDFEPLVLPVKENYKPSTSVKEDFEHIALTVNRQNKPSISTKEDYQPSASEIESAYIFYRGKYSANYRSEQDREHLKKILFACFKENITYELFFNKYDYLRGIKNGDFKFNKPYLKSLVENIPFIIKCDRIKKSFNIVPKIHERIHTRYDEPNMNDYSFICDCGQILDVNKDKACKRCGGTIDTFELSERFEKWKEETIKKASDSTKAS